MSSVYEVSPSSLAALLDSVDAPIIAIDCAGLVQWVNDAAEQWLGRSRRRLVGHSAASSDPWGPRLVVLADHALADEMAVHDEITHDGVTVEVAACPWWDAGAVRGVVLQAHMPRTLTAGHDRSDVSALAAGLAHEVRNPLAALRGAAELLTAELGESETSLREYVDLILRETARVDALVARLLTVARPLPLHRTRFRGDELIHDLARHVQALAQARRVPVTVDEEYDPTLPELTADRERLFDALANLVKNAVEALPASGGRITLNAGIDPKRRRTSAGARTLVAFTVRDTGPGLGTSRDRLFTPFYTTKANGTGLGLLMARRAVEAHGGVLTLRDRVPPDCGTEAQVLVPIEATHG